MATSTVNTNKPIIPRGVDDRPVDKYNRAELYSGKALDFDGVNDVVSVGAEGGTYNDFTLVWNLKTSYASDFQGIFSTGSVQDFYINSTGQIRVFIGASYDTTTLPRVNSGEWVNFVFTRSGSTGSFYYNGVLVETLTISTTALNNTDVRIGTNQYGSYPFNGEMAGVKLFNTALTAAQVADLYNNPEKVVPTGVDNTALKLWLPMQEGAGTTAYDGSGNGNHGTISGATYVNGIGAPVSQTAVIDWNKGANLIKYSERLNEISGSAWITTSTSVTANDTTAPDGQTTADKIEFTASGAEIYTQFINVASSLHIGSVFLKNDDIGSVQLEIIGGAPGILGQTTIDLTDGSLSASVGDYTPVATDEGNGWYRVSVGDTGGTTIATPALKIKRVGANGSFYAWGAQVEASDSLGAYIPNNTGTPITSPVLLPQGLTSGRDITGVNLFENVRKQGALNLDDNSWAEVHDNASLDITDAITLEAWVYWVPQTSSNNGILSRWDSSANKRSYILYQTSTGNVQVNVSTDGATSNGVDALSAPSSYEWHHIVGTYDGSEIKIYVDGAYSDKVSYTGNIYVTDINTDIAAYNNGNYLNSQLAQPRIYNRALTAEEVLNNYNTTKDLYI